MIAVVGGVDPWRPAPATLVGLGGSGGPGAGEAWRLLTAWTVHAGAIHVGFDLLLIALVGPALERRVGSIPVAVAFLGGAVVAAATSRWWNPYVLSVGASGGAFALAAALGVRLIRQRPSGRLAIAGLVAFAAANAIAAALAPAIDHAAHLGGALAGAAVGALAGRVWIASGILVAATVAAVVTSAPPRDDLAAAVTAIDDLEGRYEELLANHPAEDAALAAAIRDRIVAPLDRIAARLADGGAPPSRPRARLAAYLGARRASLDLYARYLETGDTALRNQIVDAEHAVRAALEQLRAP